MEGIRAFPQIRLFVIITSANLAPKSSAQKLLCERQSIIVVLIAASLACFPYILDRYKKTQTKKPEIPL